jgi:hypothetical protein
MKWDHIGVHTQVCAAQVGHIHFSVQGGPQILVQMVFHQAAQLNVAHGMRSGHSGAHRQC